MDWCGLTGCASRSSIRAHRRGSTAGRFTDLYETSDGTLLIGTEDGGLTVYRNGIFTTYTTADGLPSNEVYPIFPDFNGEPVISTAKGLRLSARRQIRPRAAAVPE